MRIAETVAIACLILISSSLANGTEPELCPNDVSWLWPVPQSSDDLDDLISMDALKSDSGENAWSSATFNELHLAVESDDAKVSNQRIRLKQEFKELETWKIVAMRVDPSAPGANKSLVEHFGSAPQIRLIVQPVTKTTAKPVVHDFAVHLVFSFLRDGERGTPDREKFIEILKDLDSLKKLSSEAGISTDGPLGVHPGLKAKINGLSEAVRRFLARHLTSDHLSAMAMMGLPNDFEPWIFVALSPSPSGFKRVPFLAPQMLSFLSNDHVIPSPVVNNLNAISSVLFVPEPADRMGVSTAILFQSTVNLEDSAAVGIDKDGNQVLHESIKIRDIADIVANPQMSHFFNTDCVSCHTESQRREILRIPESAFTFKTEGHISQIASDVVSNHQWNVRNFGWFPDALAPGRPTTPTVTQRTANETAEVVEFIKKEYSSR